MPVTEEVHDGEPAGTVSEDLAGALSVWNQRVRDKEKELETAEARLETAEARLASTEQQIEAIKQDLLQLESQVADRAISAFMDQDLSEIRFVSYQQVQEATRMRTLLASAVKTDFDIAEDLRIVQEELAIQQAIADEAKQEADEARALIAEELVEVEEARDQKASLTAKAAASLGVVTDADIVTVRGFKVHRDIADAVAGMIDHAASQGYTLGGGGYRSFESQVEIRKNNCGTSYYAIWQMSARQCRPPTARPGASMHEKGMALDLTCDRALIRSRSNRCFQWLAANANNYGFQNLPSEPWHWSVNGR
ncbi:MAG: D-alanyl-D-alanine carboxypeptidase family protein [Acidimicrobiia bacterium]|nr:D-alanyl-D-alanine carboxypeptidase family protein [Acidimicrobiia bacterium]